MTSWGNPLCATPSAELENRFWKWLIVRQLTECEAQLPILAFGPHADPNLLKKLAW
jgi:hypothetical protein